MSKAESLFSQQDKDRLAVAVKAAEERTSGEIVPYVVAQSDTYPEAWLRSGISAAFIVLFIFSLIGLGTDLWLPVGIAEVSLIALAAFALAGLAATYIPALKRLFIPTTILQQRVDERAALAFLDEEVFSTRDRTGILLFISLFERRVRVLGDAGINAKVEQSEWDDVTRLIVEAMKAGLPADGMLQAIDRCGQLLERRGVEIRPDDTNELDNTVRFSDR